MLSGESVVALTGFQTLKTSSNLKFEHSVDDVPAVGCVENDMSEPLEIIDPFETIREAFAQTETVEHKQPIKPQQVWLTAAVAVVSIITLTLVHTLSPGSGHTGHIASLNDASELASSTTGSLPNADGADPHRLMPPDERTHAIETTIAGGQNSRGELQKGQLAELNGAGSKPTNTQ